MLKEPRDLDLERKALSWALFHQKFFESADLREGDFWSEEHRRVYRAVQRLIAGGHPLDPVHIEQEIKRAEGKCSRECMELLLSLADVVTPPSAMLLARLKELGQCRGVVRQFPSFGQAVQRGSLPDVREAVELMVEASEQRTMGPRTRTAHEIAMEFFRRLTSIEKGERDSHRVHPGLRAFAEHLGLLPVGSVTTVGAATNVGKSTFGLSMIRDAAEHGVRCGYITCEDPEELVAARFLAMRSGVSARLMQRASTESLDLAAMRRGLAELEQCTYDVDFCQGQDHLAVVAAMRRQARRGCKLVIVDYIQAIEYAGHTQDRRNEVRLVMNRLKAEAARLCVALVVFSQLKRLEKLRGGKLKEPTKHDLKEAGDVENASEFILLMWRDREDDVADIHVRVAKAKSGGVGYCWDMVREESGMLREKGRYAGPEGNRFF